MTPLHPHETPERRDAGHGEPHCQVRPLPALLPPPSISLLLAPTLCPLGAQLTTQEAPLSPALPRCPGHLRGSGPPASKARHRVVRGPVHVFTHSLLFHPLPRAPKGKGTGLQVIRVGAALASGDSLGGGTSMLSGAPSAQASPLHARQARSQAPTRVLTAPLAGPGHVWSPGHP